MNTVALNPPIKNWTAQKVWIIGASSGIGLALAQCLHEQGAEVLLSARRVEAVSDWCATRKNTWAYPLDVSDPARVAAQWSVLLEQHGVPDLIVYAAGHYLPLRAEAFNLAEMERQNDINYLGACRVLAVALPSLVTLGRGHIALISSVAGYRGLPNALAYGPTKAALINLAEILFHDLRPRGIGVSLINPGFVKTALTDQNGFHMPALLTPDQAARQIVRGWSQGRFEIDFPKRFTFWLRLVRCLPNRLYFSLLKRIAP